MTMQLNKALNQDVNLDLALPPNDASGTWNPLGIIYCKVTMVLINNSWTIKYLAPSPTMVDSTDVPGLIAELNGERVAAIAPGNARAMAKSTASLLSFMPSPLDIAVPKDCYVLFELQGGKNWQFDGDVITTKVDCQGRYFDLNTAQDGAGNLCYAYFSAKFDTVALGNNTVNDDLFNMYLRFFEGANGSLGIRVDPDIKNPGDDVRPLQAMIARFEARTKKVK